MKAQRPNKSMPQGQSQKMLREFLLVGSSVFAFASSIARSAKSKVELTPLAILAAFFAASPALAKVQFFPKTGDKPAVISVDGDITMDDVEPFTKALEAIDAKDEALVSLNSDGGQAVAALEIGDLVRRSGISTSVFDGKTCASACATIWISARNKWAGFSSHIGFHGIYDRNTGVQPALPMALLGAHYGYLGYSQDTILWLVSASDMDMHWLTPELGEKYHIYFDYDKSKTSAGPAPPPPYAYVSPTPKQSLPRDPSPPPAPQPSASAALRPSASATHHWRVTQNLHMRILPDPRSASALAQWEPDDFIPEGTTFSGDKTPTCEPGLAGYIWCNVTYRHHNTATTAWVAADYLLSVEDNERVSCLYYPNPGPDCGKGGF